ncbi:MAG: hypothetical protein EPO08_09140 [Rhodospirillaceae bacterium]|nr:MAG: hypothetical protein EPO08_09140 [Rhodospirillaceae bacterium]
MDVTINHAGGQPTAPSSASAPLQGANTPTDVITDAKGRKLKLRELTLLEEQDLLVAMGLEHSNNALVLGRAFMAARIAEIDGAPVLVPTNHIDYRALLQRVGKDGLAAVLAATATPDAAAEGDVARAKN